MVINATVVYISINKRDVTSKCKHCVHLHSRLKNLQRDAGRFSTLSFHFICSQETETAAPVDTRVCVYFLIDTILMQHIIINIITYNIIVYLFTFNRVISLTATTTEARHTVI